MSQLDFPNPPLTVGQTWAGTNGATYTWDGTVWTVQGMPIGTSPSGPAGGDLTGTYPNPTVGPLAVGNAEISDVAWSKVTGPPSIPTTLPPSGPAGGDLTGTYPNPTVGPLAVGNAEISDLAYTKLTGTPTSLPPSGAAGGALSGTYPNPGVTYSAITGTPTSLPPSGAAGGDLQGTYPNPTIKPTSLPWTPSQPTGGTLTPTDATKTIAIPGDANFANVVLGSVAVKGRLETSNTGTVGATIGLFANRNWANGNAQDDGTKPSWGLQLGGNDFLLVQRSPAGSTTQAALLTLDNAGSLTVPGNITGGNLVTTATGNVVFGTMGQLVSTAGAATQFQRNYSGMTGYDNTKPSWGMFFHSNDNWYVFRGAAGVGSANTQLFQLDNAGNLTIAGATATKASGTTWANPSDRRLKEEIVEYTTGLAAIRALAPRTFLYNGKAGSQGGMRGYGFIADEVAGVMPEMVGTTRVKLNADDADETEIQTLDTSNLVLALVNAVKELTTRLEAVEGR